MPSYTIKDNNTGEYYDVICSWNELQENLKENPNLEQTLTVPAIVSGVVTPLRRAGNEWKDVLSRVKGGSGRNNTVHD